MRTTLAIFLCIITLGAAMVAADGPRRAPGFALPDSNMQVHDLYDYRGKPVILEFMLTTCPHCAAFTPVLQKVQQKYGNRVAILAVVNPPDDMNAVKQYIAGHQITFPILFDMGQAAYSYILKPSFSQPQVYLIDPKGMIFAHYEYSALTRDIFEGNGLSSDIDRMLGPGASTPSPKK
jgi:peroxiredoxin